MDDGNGKIILQSDEKKIQIPERLKKTVIDQQWDKRNLKTPDGTVVIETDQTKNKRKIVTG